MDLAEGKIGPEASYELDFVEGKLVMTLKYDGAQADALLTVALDPVTLIDKLEEVIPGDLDKAVFSILKAALK